jgi:hypothetical protein
MAKNIFQQRCDQLTQVVLFRRLNQPEPKPQLYLCRVRERVRDQEVAWVIISEDFPIHRVVICGGNAGFGHTDTFHGNARGCDLGFRCEVFESVSMIDLDVLTIKGD